MTCIVGVVHDGQVTLGADSAASDGHQIRSRQDQKMFVRDGFVFGWSGTIRPRQLLAHKVDIPKRHPETDVAHYMVCEFVEAVRRCFRDGGVLHKKDEIETFDGSFLVGHAGRLFKVASDLQVAENSEGFDALGSGEEFALGALYVTRALDVRQRLTQALLAAEAFQVAVRGPFYFETV